LTHSSIHLLLILSDYMMIRTTSRGAGAVSGPVQGVTRRERVGLKQV